MAPIKRRLVAAIVAGCIVLPAALLAQRNVSPTGRGKPNVIVV